MKLERIEINANLGIVHNELENYEEAADIFAESVQIAKELGSKHLEQLILMLLGITHWMLNQVPEAYKCFEQACQLAEALNDEEKIAQACVLFGKLELDQGYPKKALGHLNISREKAVRAVCIKTLTLADHMMGDTYVIVIKPQEAIKHYKQFLEFDENDESEQATARLKMRAYYTDCNDYKSVIECYHEGLRLSLKLNDKRKTESEARESLGISYYHAGDYKKAQECCKEAWAIANAQEYTQLQVRVDMILGDVFCQKRMGKSFKFLFRMLEDFTKSEKATKIRILSKLASSARNIGRYQMAISLHRQQTDIANGIEEKACAFQALGTDYELVHEFDKALDCYKKFLEFAEKMNDVEKGQASVDMERVHLLKGEYNKAIELSKNAESLGDKSVIAKANSVMGCAYTGRGEYGKAIEKIQKEIENTETNDKLKIARAKGNLGKAYIGADGYGHAVVCFRDQMKLAHEIRDKKERGRANENLGDYYDAIGEFNEALLKYKAFLKIANELEDEPGISRANSCIGTIHTEMGRCRNAVKCHEKELKTAKKLGNKVCEGHAFGNLANAYAGLGEYKKPLNCMKKV